MTLRAVDCLGFAGGFTMGMVAAGFQLVGKREMKGGFGVANCEVNRHLLGDDWHAESVDPNQWTIPTGGADVIFGNPPCSGFSVMSNQAFRGADSVINHCMWAFVEYAARVVPAVAVFESVQMAFTRPDGLDLMRRLRYRLEELTNERYTLTHVLHNAYAVGGAAIRRRYFWVVSRVPFGVQAVAPDRLPLLDDVIGDLGTCVESWELVPYTQEPSDWARPRVAGSGSVDGHMSVRNPLTLRIRDLMEGVTWRPGESIATVARRHYLEYGRLPASWSASEAKLVGSNFNMGFTTPVRWRGDAPARVITGGSVVTTVHPHLPRTLSHREVARIMGFPDDWLIEPLRNLSGLQATWGKGITVDCGSWIGHWIREALGGHPGDYAGSEIGDREFLIDATNWYDPSLIQSSLTPEKKFKKLLGADEPSPTKGVPMTEPVTATEEVAQGKGRPRPQSTVDQDARALEAITAAANAGTPLTKEALAEAIGVAPNKAYLSLYRLRVDGQIHKVRDPNSRGYVWVPGVAEAVEVPA